MTQTTLATQSRFTPSSWVPVLSLWLISLRAWCHRVWAAMTNATPHHGAGLLLGGDSLRVQMSLAVILGDVHKALIVQKFHEWIEYNKSQGSPLHRQGGQWWTYGAYSDWVRDHFSWLTPNALGYHIRALETMGVIKSRQEAKRDRKKWYTIDYVRLSSLIHQAEIEGVHLAFMPSYKPVRSHSDRVPTQSDPVQTQTHHVDSHDDSRDKSIKESKRQSKNVPPPTPPQKTEVTHPQPPTDRLKGDTQEDSVPESQSTTEQTASQTLPQSSAKDPLSLPPGSQEIVSRQGTRSTTAGDVWAMVQNQLILKGFKDFEGAALAGFEWQDGTGIYTVSVLSENVAKLLATRYRRGIEKTFEGLHHPSPLKIVYMTKKDPSHGL